MQAFARKLLREEAGAGPRMMYELHRPNEGNAVGRQSFPGTASELDFELPWGVCLPKVRRSRQYRCMPMR